ncbi:MULTISPECIES: tRNA-uridine aminocarboxypropyltransferase [Shewanella]|uniref:tRNA-uridine aminocarboxypropyltransferase n=1 Tax=Shewanella chilikensis TaxID=558541 RepID=A0A6G7LM80_9GAMM|nr:MULTISPECIES: tRNA-uridine aminocarboxypropyltransferase [Shewanella]QIJ02879.1 DTW domain-containing protein [Shewanella chilikensis]HCD15091.1 DTW domain-containing protein [Shewanella sp.]
MSRRYCEQCGYPETACVCTAVSAIYPGSQLLVLQHPSEVEHAKNSVRLLQLAVPDTRVIVGETEADFAELRAELTTDSMPTFLLYPSDNSQLLQADDSSEAVRLILLDGTWRKTLKMYRLNPWLQALPQRHLPLAVPTAYRIRKANRSDSLSTLEAAAAALSQLEPGLDVAPMYALLAELVEQRLRRMPAKVRERY